MPLEYLVGTFTNFKFSMTGVIHTYTAFSSECSQQYLVVEESLSAHCLLSNWNYDIKYYIATYDSKDIHVYLYQL